MEATFKTYWDSVFNEVNLLKDLYQYWYDPKFISFNDKQIFITHFLTNVVEVILLPSYRKVILAGIYDHTPYCVTEGFSHSKSFYIYRRNQWDKISDNFGEFTFYQSFLTIFCGGTFEIHNIKNGDKHVFSSESLWFSKLLLTGDLISTTQKGVFLRPFMNWGKPVLMFDKLPSLLICGSDKYVVVQTKTAFYIYDKINNVRLPGFNFSRLQSDDNLTFDEYKLHGVIGETLVMSYTKCSKFNYVEYHLCLTNLNGDILLTKEMANTPLTVSCHPDYLVLRCADKYVRVDAINVTFFRYRVDAIDLIF